MNARRLLIQHGLSAKKSWGQNFLVDDNVIARIAAAVVRSEDDVVVEIGAGLGALSLALATRARRLVAVERDPDLVPILATTLAGHDNAEVVAGDALALDHAAQARRLGQRFVLAGNLPYQITSPLLFAALAAGPAAVERAVFMVQKEFADRARAQPGSKVYGRLSVMVQQLAEVKPLFAVSPGCFHPRPRVTSAVFELTLRPRPHAAVADDRLFAGVVKAAFATRRKMLRNALEAAFGEAATPALERSAIDGTRRAEVLGVHDFAAIANALSELGVSPKEPIAGSIAESGEL